MQAAARGLGAAYQPVLADAFAGPLQPKLGRVSGSAQGEIVGSTTLRGTD